MRQLGTTPVPSSPVLPALLFYACTVVQLCVHVSSHEEDDTLERVALYPPTHPTDRPGDQPDSSVMKSLYINFLILLLGGAVNEHSSWQLAKS